MRTVLRHRGAMRDENGKITPAVPDLPLIPVVIAPGGGSESAERGRDSEDVACIVYFETGTDIKNDDQLTVHDEKFNIVVNDWLEDGRGIVEVLCTRGQG